MLLLIYSFFRYICTRFHYLLSLDNDVLETSKRCAMFYNILSQNFIVKCFTKSLLIRIDFFVEILPLKDEALVMSEKLKKMGGHRLRFGENMPGRTPKPE